MLYLIAIVGLVAMTALFWRAFGPVAVRSGAPRVLGPDDDPEFLSRLDSSAQPGPGEAPPTEPDPPRG